jgi:ribosomal protein S6--L-glutamate ligase
MRRQAPEGDFRSNLHRGGVAERVEASQDEKEVALHAARALGLGVAGVDLIRAHRGPLVLEVNSTPGLEGIEQACEVDVAGAIVEFITSRHKMVFNQ